MHEVLNVQINILNSQFDKDSRLIRCVSIVDVNALIYGLIEV